LHAFDFFWTILPDGVPPLVANYDDMLRQLLELLKNGEKDAQSDLTY
jgi:hypothetical protein